MYRELVDSKEFSFGMNNDQRCNSYNLRRPIHSAISENLAQMNREIRLGIQQKLQVNNNIDGACIDGSRTQPEHIRHSSLFSSAHHICASFNSRSFSFRSDSANSGSSSAILANIASASDCATATGFATGSDC